MLQMILTIMGFSVAMLILKACALLIRKWIKNITSERNALSALFNAGYLDPRALYMYLNQEVPSVICMSEVNMTEASAHIRSAYNTPIINMYQHNSFERDVNDIRFNMTVFVLSEAIMVVLVNNEAEILYTVSKVNDASAVAHALAAFRNEQLNIGFTPAPVQVIGFMRELTMN